MSVRPPPEGPATLRSPVRSRARAPAVVAVVLPALLTAGLASIGLGREGGIWQDEAATLSATGRSLPELVALLGNVDVVHGLYYATLHGWLQVGPGIVWARTFSLVAMALAAGLVAAIGCRVVSPGLGLVAGLVFAVGPTTSFYAQEARSPAVTTLVAVLATWLLVRAVERRSAARWVGYGAACVLLVAFNELAVLVVAAHAVTVLAWTWREPDRRRTWVAWALAAAPSVLTAAALVYVSDRQAAQVGWIVVSAGAYRRLVGLWSGQTVAGLIVAAVLGALALLPAPTAAARRLRALALPLFLVPSALLMAASLAVPLLVPRYVLFTTAGLALLCALGVDRLGRLLVARGAPARTPVAVAVVVLAVLSVGGLARQQLNRTPASRVDDTGASAAVVGANARPGDALLFAPDLRRLDALTHPEEFEGLRDLSLAQDAEDADNLYGSELPPAVVEQRIRAAQRVWVVGSEGLRVSDRVAGAADSQAELALLNRDFRLVQRFPLHGSEVGLFVRAT